MLVHAFSLDLCENPDVTGLIAFKEIYWYLRPIVWRIFVCYLWAVFVMLFAVKRLTLEFYVDLDGHQLSLQYSLHFFESINIFNSCYSVIR